MQDFPMYSLQTIVYYDTFCVPNDGINMILTSIYNNPGYLLNYIRTHTGHINFFSIEIKKVTKAIQEMTVSQT